MRVSEIGRCTIKRDVDSALDSDAKQKLLNECNAACKEVGACREWLKTLPETTPFFLVITSLKEALRQVAPSDFSRYALLSKTIDRYDVMQFNEILLDDDATPLKDLFLSARCIEKDGPMDV